MVQSEIFMFVYWRPKKIQNFLIVIFIDEIVCQTFDMSFIKICYLRVRTPVRSHIFVFRLWHIHGEFRG